MVPYILTQITQVQIKLGILRCIHQNVICYGVFHHQYTRCIAQIFAHISNLSKLAMIWVEAYRWVSARKTGNCSAKALEFLALNMCAIYVICINWQFHYVPSPCLRGCSGAADQFVPCKCGSIGPAYDLDGFSRLEGDNIVEIHFIRSYSLKRIYDLEEYFSSTLRLTFMLMSLIYSCGFIRNIS